MDKLESVLSTDSRLEIETKGAIDCDAARSDTENVSHLVIGLPNDNQGTEENRDGSPEDRRVSSYEDISPPRAPYKMDIQLTTPLPVAAFFPIMKGDFGVVLKGSVRNELEICLESCDPSVQKFVGMHLVYVATVTQVSISVALCCQNFQLMWRSKTTR